LHAPYAHIFVSEEEQRSIPAADHPINIRPSYSPIIIIGASHLAAPRLGQVLAASIGWAHINPAQDAIERLNDTAGLGWRNESVRNAIRGRFLARIESALHGGLRHTVLSLSQADICESDDVVAALNTLRGSLIVVLTPSDRALETYEALELDSAMTWAGKSISQWNRANFIRLAVDRVVSSLRSGPSHVITIPFAPEIAPGQGVDINSVHDGVADEIVEVAAAITRRLRIPPDDLSGLLGLYKRQIAGRATRVHIKTI
jgi:hypothetical protein